MTNIELRKYLQRVKRGQESPSPASVAQRALKLLGELERAHILIDSLLFQLQPTTRWEPTYIEIQLAENLAYRTDGKDDRPSLEIKPTKHTYGTT